MNKTPRLGKLAEQAGYKLELEVLQSNAGYYIGTFFHNPENPCDYGPCSRESEEYYLSRIDAQYALDNNEWTQR